MQTKLVILNAPPKVGKDSSAEYIAKSLGDTINLVSFKEPSFGMVLPIFGISHRYFFECYNDPILKEKPNPKLVITQEVYLRLCRVKGVGFLKQGESYTDLPDMVMISPRDAMIYVSECIAKPLFGDDVFGKRILNQIKEGKINLCTDGDDIAEIVPSINHLGKDNVSIIRIFKQGYDFSPGYGKYLTNELTTYNACIYNNSSTQDFHTEMLETVLKLSSL